MITDDMVAGIAGLAGWAIDLMPRLPVWNGESVGTAVNTFVTWLSPGLAALNYYLPVYWWMHLLFVLCGLEAALAVWTMVKFVLGFIRGVDLA